ncbi:hypothetical protein MNEG_11223, partial [Monoraphidium neglectum]
MGSAAAPTTPAATASPDEFQRAQLSKHLLLASESGAAPLVARLLRQGADVNARDEGGGAASERYSAGYTLGRTPLIRAAQQ